MEEHVVLLPLVFADGTGATRGDRADERLGMIVVVVIIGVIMASHSEESFGWTE